MFLSNYTKSITRFSFALCRNLSSTATYPSFEEDFLRNHCQTNLFQKTLLTIGASAVSILDPYRADMISCLGETTGIYALKYMKEQMEKSPEGSMILHDQPRINTDILDLDYLKTLPVDTLGYIYYKFLEKNHVTPDSRTVVQFVDDIELAYVIQRYREVHDLIHTILRMPTSWLGEVTVKWVEAIQFKLPMCIAAATLGPIRMKSKDRSVYLKYYLPWAINTGTTVKFLLNIYFEKRWEQKIDDFYKEFNIKPLELN